MARDFTPTLFVGIGEHYNFFTLRETYLHTTYIRGEGDMGGCVLNGVYQGTIQTEVRSFHHQNLSTDADEAWAKALALAEVMGLKLDGERADLDINMAAIRRASAEELEARERARAAQEAEWAAQRAERELARRQMIEQGRFPFGINEGRPFAEMSQGYLTWIVRKVEDFDADSLLRLVAAKLVADFPQLLLPEPKPTAFWKAPSVRATANVTVTRVHSFSRPKYNAPWVNETVYLAIMVTDAGECLVSKGTSFAPNVGDRFTIKATVKQHDWYNDQAQTVVQRIVIVSETELAA